MTAQPMNACGYFKVINSSTKNIAKIFSCVLYFTDHQDRHKYCVLNSVGMFQVTLPWINRVEDCASDSEREYDRAALLLAQ